MRHLFWDLCLELIEIRNLTTLTPFDEKGLKGTKKYILPIDMHEDYSATPTPISAYDTHFVKIMLLLYLALLPISFLNDFSCACYFIRKAKCSVTFAKDMPVESKNNYYYFCLNLNLKTKQTNQSIN